MASFSSSLVAAVLESINGSSTRADSNSSRQEMLKKKYAGIIDKSKKALEANQTAKTVERCFDLVNHSATQILWTKSVAVEVTKSVSKKRRNEADDHLPATQTLCTKSVAVVADSERVSKKRKNEAADQHSATQTLCTKSVAVADTERVSKKRKNEAADHHSAAQTRCTKSVAIVVDTEGVSKKKKKKKNETEELKRKDLERKAEIQKMREAARRKVERMSVNVDIDDPQQVLRDFMKLAGYSNKDRAMDQHVSFSSYGSNAHLFKSSDVRKLMRSSVCCDKYIENSKSATDKRRAEAKKEGEIANGEELEEGEIPNDDEVEEGEITD